MAWMSRSAAPQYAVNTLSKLSGLSSGQCAELVGAVYARKRHYKWIPEVTAALAFLGWMFVFGRTTDALENTDWDLLASLGKFGIGGFAITLLLGYGVALALAFLLGRVVPRAVMRRELKNYLCSPACFFCGYSLRGLDVQRSAIRCPECGKTSPVARQAL